MPLDPKQQPPYYTPGTTPTPSSGGTTRLNTQYNAVQTTATSETDMYSYTMPANTLLNNGDTLTLKYCVTQVTVGNSQVTRFYFNGELIHSTDTSPATFPRPTILEIQLIKISSNQAISSQRFIMSAQAAQQTFQNTTTVDFTLPITMKFTGQCGTGQQQTYSLTIDKTSI